MASIPGSTTLLLSSSSPTTAGCSAIPPSNISAPVVHQKKSSCVFVPSVVSSASSSLIGDSKSTPSPVHHNKNLVINNTPVSTRKKSDNNTTTNTTTNNTITTTFLTKNATAYPYKNDNVTIISNSKVGVITCQGTSLQTNGDNLSQTTSVTDLPCSSTIFCASGLTVNNEKTPSEEVPKLDPFPLEAQSTLILQAQHPLSTVVPTCPFSSSLLSSSSTASLSIGNNCGNISSRDTDPLATSTINTVPNVTMESTCPSPTSQLSSAITNANIPDIVTTTNSSSSDNDRSTSTTMNMQSFFAAVTDLDTNFSSDTITTMSHTSGTNTIISSDNNPVPNTSPTSKTLLLQPANCTDSGTESESPITASTDSSSGYNSSEISTTDNSNSINTMSSSSTLPVPTKPMITGPKYKLITEGEIQVCRLNHTRTIVSKIMNSKYLRRWENHHLILASNEIRSTSPTGFMSSSIPYSSIEDIHTVSRWDAGHKFCIRITVQEGSVLLQANSSYLRDQWLHSIKWKKHVHKYEKLLKTARRPEVVVKEIKNMIDVSLNTPIHDTSVYQFPLELVSELLQSANSELTSKSAHENIIIALTPLLENNHPTQEICEFLIKHCKKSPRSSIVIDLFTPVAQRILKHNTDFGKLPNMRRFVQEYILALNSQNDGFKVVQAFVRNMHGQSSTCPHPRVLPNLVAVCLASIYSCYEEKKKGFLNNANISEEDWNKKLLCYIKMFETMSQYDDWRCIVGSLLQPIPFPDDAVGHGFFTSHMKTVIQTIASDHHCDTHQTILSIRENKEGWFHLYCPGNICCDDDGELWGIMLETLIRCCCRRKKFLQELSKSVNPIMLLALRGKEAAMEALCGMLEMDVIDTKDLKMQMITTLQTTSTGKQMYTALCERQIALRELQQKGGPKKLSLPPQSTDADLVKMLGSGSFGNLESLSLAFTQVTSACAQELIKLPTLRSLNLWSTQFGDAGLQLISEHLPRLQVLNLCETPVTDKGLVCLATLKNLRKLNLNSTNLSALTFEGLKEKLPVLQECDVRYTEAW